MIDKAHDLPVVRQAQLLELSRSSIYYQPQPIPEDDLWLMRRIDELHLEHPFAGARMLCDMLKLEGHEIGRKHVSTLMKQPDIQAIYRTANPSRRTTAAASRRSSMRLLVHEPMNTLSSRMSSMARLGSRPM